MSDDAPPAAWRLSDYATIMARYNRWMNEKVYAAAAMLSDEQRKANRGAFFQSVHGTLNHLLLTDEAWMQRLHGQPVSMTSPDEELHSDFEALREARIAMDQRLMDWAVQLEDVGPTHTLSFFSVSYQKQITLPYVVAVMQVFNHQTHHRGQVTTLLTQLGVDVGPTDLPMTPGLQ